jgi:hypothetical protein
MTANHRWWETFPWGLVSVILAVIALAVTVVFFYKGRGRKTLDYMLVDDVKILPEGVSGIRSDIVVTVGGTPIKDPRIITVRYINTGNREILQSDFLVESITTKDDSGIVNSQLTGHSRNLAVTESGVDPHKSYTADCLNAGEYLEIQYLLEMDGVDDAAPFSPICRIQGASREARLLERAITRAQYSRLAMRLLQELPLLGSFVALGISVSEIMRGPTDRER